MNAVPTALYDEAAEWAKSRPSFSGERFQRVMHVGFVMRDRLLIALEDDGVIRRAGSDRYERVA